MVCLSVVRIAATAGLASLGQADSANLLIETADAAEGWERIQVTRDCLVLAEKLTAAGNKSAARRIYEHLRKTRNGDSEQHIRDAARRGLAAIV